MKSSPKLKWILDWDKVPDCEYVVVRRSNSPSHNFDLRYRIESILHLPNQSYLAIPQNSKLWMSYNSMKKFLISAPLDRKVRLIYLNKGVFCYLGVWTNRVGNFNSTNNSSWLESKFIFLK